MTCAAFNLQGDTLALGGEDTVEVFATDALFTPGAHPKILPGKAQQVAFRPDGKILAAVDDAWTVTLWDLDRGKPVTEPLELTDASGSWRGKRVALTWEGADRLLAAKSWELGDTSGYAISLWDVRQRQLLGEPLRGHKEQVLCMAFSSDARTLASGDAREKFASGMWPPVSKGPYCPRDEPNLCMPWPFKETAASWFRVTATAGSFFLGPGP